MQNVFNVLYPQQCILCDARVDGDNGLCGPCWREMPFIAGSACYACGAPLMGEAVGDEHAYCDDCMAMPRPWRNGAAALLYKDNGRRVVLALKHGDRQDLVPAAAKWMAGRLRAPLDPETLLVPIPIHWRRMLKRRFNQSAVLTQALARANPTVALPDALVRLRHTPVQDGLTLDGRFANQHGAFAVRPGREKVLAGRRVVLVDDVMTSGATLAAATEVLRATGVTSVDVLTLARVVKDT